VTVDVEGKAYIGVAQKLLNELGIYTLFQQERGAGVPQVVEAGALREPGALERSLESAVEVAAGQGSADAGGEHKSLLLPEPSLLYPLLKLALTVLSESQRSLAGEPDAPALAGLGSLEDVPTLRLGERAPDLEHPGFEV
jgi:hypothetical protein